MKMIPIHNIYLLSMNMGATEDKIGYDGVGGVFTTPFSPDIFSRHENHTHYIYLLV